MTVEPLEEGTMVQRASVVFETMKSRRAVRHFTDEPVAEPDLRRILEAARWASAGGNRRIHKFLVVQDPAKIRLVQLMSPGMFGLPPALIITCTDTRRAAELKVNLVLHKTPSIDVGTGAMNMQLMAHALGLGSCIVTSFSRSGVATMLDIPDWLTPELMLMVGRPAPNQRRANRPPNRSTRLTVDDLTFWERVP